jgi:hypothetical protein
MSLPSFNVERKFSITIGLNQTMAWELVQLIDDKEDAENGLPTHLFNFREQMLGILPREPNYYENKGENHVPLNRIQ